MPYARVTLLNALVVSAAVLCIKHLVEGSCRAIATKQIHVLHYSIGVEGMTLRCEMSCDQSDTLNRYFITTEISRNEFLNIFYEFVFNK